MKSSLFAKENMEINSGERFTIQHGKMLKVALGEEVLARKGSMVAYQGNVEFHHKSAGGVGKWLKQNVTGEDTPLMTVGGSGEVFFADTAKHVFLVHLEGDGITVNGESLLAFDANLEYDVKRVKGAGMLSGGLFNTEIHGHGVVALCSDGAPIILDCSQNFTAVDTQAAVCWSSSLTPQVKNSMNMKSMLRGGTGEAFQYGFQGQGFVVVQPSEGRPVVAQDGGSSSGGGLSSLLS